MVASKQVEIPFYNVIGLQRWRGFGALAQGIGRTTILFLRRYIVPAANSVGADFLEFALPEIAVIVNGRKKFKKAAKTVGGQTLRKLFGSGSRKKSARRVFPTKSAKQTSRSPKVSSYKYFSLTMSSNFRYHAFVAVSGNLAGKVTAVDYFLSSHEQEIYPTTSLDRNCIEFDFQMGRIDYVDLR